MRAHPFANAQNQQTSPQLASYFVYVISDYTIVTITNLLMEQTRTNAGAFIDESKLIVDGGFRTAANNVAFELFGDGSGTRGYIGSTVSNAPTYTITLSNSQQVVQFEVGQNLVNYVYSAGSISSISSTTGYVSAVDRSGGVLTITASGTDASWATAGNALGIYGDIQSGAVGTGTGLCMSGLAAWIPSATPATVANGGTAFWGVDRGVDPTRLAGLTVALHKLSLIDLEARQGDRAQACVFNTLAA